MTLEITRLHLASLQGIDGGRWPMRRIRSLRPERVHSATTPTSCTANPR